MARIPVFSIIKRRIQIVDIFLVKPLPQELKRLSETLEVYDFPLPQEFDNIIYIGVVRQPKNIVIRYPGFLFRGQVLRQICNGVSLDPDPGGAPREARSRGRVDACGVVYEIGRKPVCSDLLL